MDETLPNEENTAQSGEHNHSGDQVIEKHLVETAKAETTDMSPQKNRPGPGWFAVFVLCLLVSVASAASSVYVYDRYYALKFVAVDIKGYLAEQRDLYIAHKIDDEQLKQALDKLGAAVDRIPKNRVVVMADAVIRNVEVVKP